MTPSKEARDAVEILLRYCGYNPETVDEGGKDMEARIIDAQFAPYRERVRRLVEAAEAMAVYFPGDGVSDVARAAQEAHLTRLQTKLKAALAPFLEQETVTP